MVRGLKVTFVKKYLHKVQLPPEVLFVTESAFLHVWLQLHCSLMNPKGHGVPGVMLGLDTDIT